MILDYIAKFSDGQTGTVSVAHTDYIDTEAAGQSYEGAFFVFRVDTAFSQTGTASRLTVQVQTSEDSSFLNSTTATMVQSATFSTSDLTAGKYWAVRLPMNAKRYIRAYNSVSGTSGSTHIFTGGAWDSFITNDIDREINKRYAL